MIVANPSRGFRKFSGDHWLGILLIAMVVRTPVRAHDAVEVERLLWNSDGSKLTMLSTRGLIFGSVDERQFRLMCTEALAISRLEQPDLAVLNDGSVLIATSSGLSLSSDEGCTWRGVEPFAMAMTTAMAQEPSSRDALYLAIFDDDRSGIHASRDAGQTWTLLLSTGPGELVQELGLGPEGSGFVYASGKLVAGGQGLSHFFLRSEDAGATWQRLDYGLLPSEHDVVLSAVSPVDPMTVLAKTGTSDPRVQLDRLQLSHDGARTFTVVLEAEQLHDAAFTDDGRGIWAAGNGGLWRADTGGSAFTKLEGPQWMSCVTEHDGVLWACGRFAPDLDGVAALTSEQSAFEPRMLFSEVSSQVACLTGSETATLCSAPWGTFQTEVRLMSSRLRPSAVGTSAGRDRLESATSAAGPQQGARAERDDAGGCSPLAGAPPSIASLIACAGFLIWRQRRQRCPSGARMPSRWMPH
jgi:hypothetical protein